MTQINPFVQQRNFNQSVMGGGTSGPQYGTGTTPQYGQQGGGFSNQFGQPTQNTQWGGGNSFSGQGGSQIGSGTASWKPTYNYGTPQWSMPTTFDVPQQERDWLEQNQPQNQPGQGNTTSPDGLVTFDPSGQRLDSLGHPALGDMGSNNNGGGGQQPLQGLPMDGGQLTSPNRSGQVGGGLGGDERGVVGGMPSATGLTWEQYSKLPPDQQAMMNNWLNYQLQLGQQGQGATEFGQNFGEQVRQFDANMTRQVGNDAFSQMMAQLQFGQSVKNDAYGQQADTRNYVFQQQQADRGYDLQKNAQQLESDIQRGQLALAGLTQQQRNAIEAGQLNLANLTQQQRHYIEQGQLALQQKTQRDQNALANRGQDFQEFMGRGQLNFQGQQLQQQGLQWDKDFGLRSQQQTFQQGLDSSGLRLAQKTQEDERILNQGKLALDQLTQQQNNAIAQGNLQLAQQIQNQKNQIDQGMLSIQNRGMNLQERESVFNQGLARDQFGLQSDIQRGQLALGQTTERNRFAIDQGNLALNQLTQQQNNAIAQGNLQLAQTIQQQKNQIEQATLAQQFQLQSRGYNIEEAGLQQQGQLSREQMAQQLQIENLRLAAQREQAALQAGGRLRSRNVNWLRAG